VPGYRKDGKYLPRDSAPNAPVNDTKEQSSDRPEPD
jgi:hypothetical protein